MLEDLKKYVTKDIHFRLSPEYLEGASSTYFSGKMLAKLGRILVIADELRGMDNSWSVLH